MQSRIFEIESSSAPEPSEVERSRNRHLRFATDLKAWPRPESFSGRGAASISLGLTGQMRGRFANFI
jgi:hypothetical protein